MHTDLTMPMFAGWWIAVTFDVRGDSVVIGRWGWGGGERFVHYALLQLPDESVRAVGHSARADLIMPILSGW